MKETIQTTPISYLYDKTHNETFTYEIADVKARKDIEWVSNLKQECKSIVENAKNSVIEDIKNSGELKVTPISISGFTPVGDSGTEYKVSLSDGSELEDTISVPKGNDGVGIQGIEVESASDTAVKLVFSMTNETTKEVTVPTVKGDTGDPTQFMVYSLPENPNKGDQVIYVGPENERNGLTFGQTYICKLLLEDVCEGGKLTFNENGVNTVQVLLNQVPVDTDGTIKLHESITDSGEVTYTFETLDITSYSKKQLLSIFGMSCTHFYSDRDFLNVNDILHVIKITPSWQPKFQLNSTSAS